MRLLNSLDSNFSDLEKTIYYFNGNTIYRDGHPEKGVKKELINNEYANHWEKIFWNSLKECDEYLNLIVKKRIPID